MKKIILVTVAATLLLSVWLIAGCESKGPKLVVDQNSFSFGAVEQNSTVTHVFALRNDGDEEIQIKKVKSSCGCTAAEPTTKLIKPGEKAEIKATFSVGGRRGHQKKQITVESNDPVNPRLYLYLEGDILERLVYEPRSLRLMDLEPGQKTTGEVKITNKSQAPITINEVKFDDPNVLEAVFKGEQPITLPYELPAGQSVTLVLTVQMPADKDNYRASVSVVTSDRPDQPETIAVVLRKKGAIVKPVKPKKVGKKKVKPGKKKNKKNKNKKKKKPAEE